MQQNIISCFNNLPIDGSKILQFKIEPLKKISMSIVTFPLVTSDRNVACEYDLLFSKIIDCKFDVPDISSKISAHSVFPKSVFLDGCKASTKKYSAKFDKMKLLHYQIVFEQGEMNVVAELFTCSVVWQV